MLELRKAILGDIPAVTAMVNAYAAQGVMLPRTEFELAESIRDFTVAYRDGQLVGCGALRIYTPLSAEVRSLAVSPREKGSGIGRQVVEALVAEAEQFGLESLFAFTYVPGFFAKLGFSEVDRGQLPLKAWKDCLRCPKFKACDEIAVLKPLRPTTLSQPYTPVSRDIILPILPRTAHIEVPVVPRKQG